MTRYISIASKTAFLFIAVFAIIILPVNYIIYQRVSKLLTEADSKELLAEGEKLISEVKLNPTTIPLPPSGYLLNIRLGSDLSSDVLFLSPAFPTATEELLYANEIEIDTFRIVTVNRPLEYSEAVLSLSVARSNQRLQASLAQLKVYLFLANAVSILLAVLLVYIVTRYTLRPIQKIIQAAQTINADKSIERVPVSTSSDETQLLSQTINAMLARIEHSLHQQTNFFASAAHELKTPLAVMQTELSVSLLKTEDESVKQLLQSQLNEVLRLDRVIQDFLLISQLKSETLQLKTTEVKLDELIYSSLKRVRYLIKDRGIQIKITIAESDQLHLCLVDEDKFETVITNLIENAVKYSPAKSTVTIRLYSESGRIRLEVSNPFCQSIDNIESLKDGFKKSNQLSTGLGMGLWICDQIITLHRGLLTLTHSDNTFIARVSI
ncbi:MAG: HAMP domain-containing protein [Chryseotalea sp. WA131a]|nr:MAG: HAMP domain-containing protein [Chryseotalea sp. WA131a]